MIPKFIDGHWRIVDGTGKPINSRTFKTWDDAASYIDKFDDLRGQI